MAHEPAIGSSGRMSLQCTSGMREVRQAAGYRADDCDAVSGEVPDCAGRGCADDGQHGAGHFGGESAKSEDEGEYGEGDEQRRQMQLREAAADFGELNDGLVGVDLDAEHLAENRDADLKADAGEEADEYGLGEEVGDEAELEQAREQQKTGGEQRHQASQGDVACAGGGRHAGESAAKDRRGGGVGGDDEIAGRAEGREGEQREEQRVKAGYDRHSGDAGVAEGLRDVHRGEDDAGECIAQWRGLA